MSDRFDPELHGALFLNKRRNAERNHPHKTGRCQINGREYYIDAWDKTGRDGQPFLSLKFKLKTPGDRPAAHEPKQRQDIDHAAAARAAARGAPPPQRDMDDDIPF
jgi:hypothetical protein